MKIEIIIGDITKVHADAIVNAANSSLLGGGGVDGAIHRAGGPAILDACKAIVERQGSCSTGEAVITTAGNLPARYVIHTVGPVWRGGSNGEAGLLASCYMKALDLGEANQCQTIAFPGISTGVYGYPKEAAAHVAVSTVIEKAQSLSIVQQVIFVSFDEAYFHLLHAAWKQVKEDKGPALG